MKNTKTRRGFTLIELLIVIAVIGLLASIVLVGLSGVREGGRDARRLSEIRQVQSLLEQYFNMCGTYPIISDAWVQGGRCPDLTGSVEDVDKWYGSEPANPGDPPPPDGLGNLLTIAGIIDAPNKLPQDPLLRGQGVASESLKTSYNYTVDYESTTAPGRRYLLQVVLEDGNNPALLDDVDDLSAGTPTWWEPLNGDVDCVDVDPADGTYYGRYCTGF